MIDGALLLDKGVGASSNAALQEAKRLFGAAKAGHAGTLDPLASGLLIVLFGEATKFAGPLLEADKEYLATLKLGEKTSTGDAEGEIVEVRPVAVGEGDVETALRRFRGPIEQLPPMHSALKRDGVPLYKLARRGEKVERRLRRVEIFELEMLRFAPPLVELRVRCSKGTYVRTLAEDIGEALGTGAHLAALRRTASGAFRVAEAASLDALAGLALVERRRRLLPLSRLLVGLPAAELDAQAEARLRNGLELRVAGIGEGLCALFRVDGGVIGLGRGEAGGRVRALRLTRALGQAAEKHR
ncbi:MAG TPA: tRNA pseudouridine(55) synthase TruB [Burkholderiales bacterium]|nr:tRNA pseudouridine(55) synthase TruB [Burkholderiales bacterium]